MAELQNIVIGTLLIALVFTGFITVYHGLVSDYNPTIDSDYNEVYESMNTTRTDVENVSGSISNKLTNNSNTQDTAEDSLYSAGFTTLKIIPNVFNNIWSMLGAVGRAIGIPTWLVAGFGTIIIIVILFGILSAIFRKSV